MTSEILSPPITYFGSKSRLVKSIVKHFPPHHTFVDAFGGSGAVLLGKKPAKVEVYNDINHQLAALFRVLADREKTRELVRRLELTPYSRQAFQEAKAGLPAETDDVELARKMIVIQRQSHGGLGERWSYSVADSSAGMSSTVRRYRVGIERLKDIQHRLRRVQVENLHFRDLLPLYDRPETLFYLDPPYVPDTRINGEYGHEMTVAEHEELVSLLLDLKGMAILSGYASEVYSPLEQAGWQRVEIETLAHTSGSRGKRTECLWVSPSCSKARKPTLPAESEIQVEEAAMTPRERAVRQLHQKRRKESSEAVKRAVATLRRTKQRVSKAEVARMTGISREHITRYYSDLF